MTAARLPDPTGECGRDLVPGGGTQSRPHSPWEQIAAIASTQQGLVSTKQVLSAISMRTLRRDIDRGRLVPYRHGLYLLAGVPRTEWQPLMAACLAGGPFVAASHRSAAILYELPGVARPPEPEVTVFGDGSLRLADVVRHRSDLCHPDDLSSVRGIPCTSAARTILDLGRYVTEYVLLRAMDSAKRRRLCTYEDVAACLDRIGGPGRHGTRWLQAALPRRLAREVDAGDSGLEVKVQEAMWRNRLPPFVLQHPVECGRRIFFIDIAWPEAKVGIEVKGDVHLDPAVADNDADRENLLTQAGWWIYDARPSTDLDQLARQITSRLRRR
jgi:very-short-patch-repair endonuclease